MILSGLVCLALTASALPANASSTTTARGKHGQTLTASIANGVLPADKTTVVTVRGRGYDTKIGIYVTFCVMPKRGQKPENCGSFDITGQNNRSTWLSSNPPLYAQFFIRGFNKGGRFKVSMPLNPTIGSFDCTKVRCAIVTRADHTDPSNRKADVLIPVTFR
jgi:hypothetical protein